MKKRRYEEEESRGGTILLIKAAVILGLCAAIFIPAWKVAYSLFVAPNIPPPEEAVKGYTPPPDPGEKAFTALEAEIAGMEPLEARGRLEEFLDTYPFSTALDKARDRLGKINTDIFFSATPSPEKERYVIQRGDAIVRLERRFGVSRELIMRCNNLEDPRKLRVGQVLFINRISFAIEVDRKKQELVLLNGHRFFKRYRAVEWHAPEDKEPVNTKVKQIIAWYQGRRVTFGSKEYAASTRWVELNASRYTFYSQSGRKPNGGIAFSDADMEELSTLLEKNVPVFIQ